MSLRHRVVAALDPAAVVHTDPPTREHPSRSAVLILQRTVGNRAVAALLQRGIYENDAAREKDDEVIEPSRLDELAKEYGPEVYDILNSSEKVTVAELAEAIDRWRAKRVAPPLTPPVRVPTSPARLGHQQRQETRRRRPVEENRPETSPEPQPSPEEEVDLPSLFVRMGQGATACLKDHRIHSSGFASCVPIVMFNSSTSRGGLFHHPAKDLERQGEVLLRMVKDVTPTEIRIYKGGHYTNNLYGMDLQQGVENETFVKEGEMLSTFFKRSCPGVIVQDVHEGAGFMQLSVSSNGELVVLTQKPLLVQQHDLLAQEAPRGATLHQREDWTETKSVDRGRLYE